MKLRWFAAIPCIIVLALAAFYISFGYAARHQIAKAGLPEENTNAVKHAMAAYQVYRVLSKVMASPEPALLWLGEMNEKLEQNIKPKPDSTLEMMKDSYNNYAGIVAAQWRSEHPELECQLGPVLFLAQRNVLVNAPEDMVMPEDDKIRLNMTRDLASAMRWTKDHHGAIRTSVTSQLKRCVQP